MNEVIRTIQERRSIRGFLPDPVEREKVEALLECARRCPNSWNNQNMEFFAVTNRKVMEEIAEMTAKYLGGEREEHNFYSAPLIIMVTDLRENYVRLADTGCAMENMFIAAKSLGLGSVWVNQLFTISDKLEVIEMLEKIGVTKDRTVTGIGAFGYPAVPPIEKELRMKVHYIE